MARGAIHLPEDYVEDSEGNLEVDISVFGRHEIIPTFQKAQRIRNLIGIAIGILALIAPYVLIYVFSGFQRGTVSTPLQRGFVMSWLLAGQVFGAFMGWGGQENSAVSFHKLNRLTLISIIVCLVIFTPAIGGFVVVGLMIKQFGSCVLV
jgi:hypothetical protein